MKNRIYQQVGPQGGFTSGVTVSILRSLAGEFSSGESWNWLKRAGQQAGPCASTEMWAQLSGTPVVKTSTVGPSPARVIVAKNPGFPNRAPHVGPREAPRAGGFSFGGGSGRIHGVNFRSFRAPAQTAIFPCQFYAPVSPRLSFFISFSARIRVFQR